MSINDPLIRMNVHFLQQGIELLQDLTNQQYRFDNSPYFSSSAGKHMRHVIDHYLSLTKGKPSTVDYDARARDTRLEQERMYAIAVIEECMANLKELGKGTDFNDFVKVRSNDGQADGDDGWSRSSVNRELQFLIGHTVHHYALIAFIVRVQDFIPPEGFGIAPSTLQHKKHQ